MDKLRGGGSPAITVGEHAGDSIALDHVLPRAVVPELAAGSTILSLCRP
jgi:hypothetical protein